MKKLSLVLVGLSIFSALVALQVGVDLTARQTDKSKQEFTHYEKVFEKLSVKDSQGVSYDFSKSKTPVVILNFWASWCKPCLEEFPALVSLRQKFPKEKLLILGINSDETGRDVDYEKAVKNHKLNFPSVRDPAGDILSEFLISAIPVSIIYHNGKVVEVSNGAKDFMAEEFLETLTDLLAQ
jgi:thiol-disulfide isomerase/thioredoxin